MKGGAKGKKKKNPSHYVFFMVVKVNVRKVRI